MTALPAGCTLKLILAGGNALGAYQAGVYQALHEHGIEADWIVGTSAGAVNGAIIAGNPPEQRLARLTALWRPAARLGGRADWWDIVPDSWRRTNAALGTILAGRTGLFAPLGSSLAPGTGTPAIYDTRPLTTTLAELVDWDRVNAGPVRLSAMAVDLDSGEDAVFDTRDVRMTADHVRASAALPPAFPAVLIGGRLYADGGLSANLPLDPVLAAPGAGPTLCIAVDLLPKAARRPHTLGDMVQRSQDLIFASQSRRSLARWQEVYAAAFGRDRSVTLARLTYVDQEREVAGKGMDFSPDSARLRWNSGHRDALALIERLERGDFVVGTPGLTIVDQTGELTPPAPGTAATTQSAN